MENWLSPSPCPAQLDGWIHEKMLMARDGTREDGHKLHKRWLRHQAFMAELAQNKEWLEKIERVRIQKAPCLCPGSGSSRELTSHLLHTPLPACISHTFELLQVISMPIPSSVALSNSCNLSEPQFAHL